MTEATRHKDIEENLREAMELSRALAMLMTGLTHGYPNSIGQEDLLAISQLADEIQQRIRAANRQWHEEPAS
ncbi:MAG: hypothetical protein ACR65X_10305 [Methylocystis sp.]